MSDQVVVTGTYNLTDVNGNVLIPFDLTKLFGIRTNVLEHTKLKRKIVDTDGVVALDKGGVATINGMILVITEGAGTVTLKHNTNSNGMILTKGIILFGSLDAVTIETSETSPITVEYLFFE